VRETLTTLTLTLVLWLSALAPAHALLGSSPLLGDPATKLSTDQKDEVSKLYVQLLDGSLDIITGLDIDRGEESCDPLTGVFCPYWWRWETSDARYESGYTGWESFSRGF